MNNGTIVEISFVAWILWTSRASLAKHVLKASLFLERLFTLTTNATASYVSKNPTDDEGEEAES